MDNKFYLHCDMDENGGWDVDGCGNLWVLLEALKAEVVTISDEFNLECDTVLGMVAVRCQKTDEKETEVKE